MEGKRSRTEIPLSPPQGGKVQSPLSVTGGFPVPEQRLVLHGGPLGHWGRDARISIGTDGEELSRRR